MFVANRNHGRKIKRREACSLVYEGMRVNARMRFSAAVFGWSSMCALPLPPPRATKYLHRRDWRSYC